jgi:hypothetical protein
VTAPDPGRRPTPPPGPVPGPRSGPQSGPQPGPRTPQGGQPEVVLQQALRALAGGPKNTPRPSGPARDRAGRGRLPAPVLLIGIGLAALVIGAALGVLSLHWF